MPPRARHAGAFRSRVARAGEAHPGLRTANAVYVSTGFAAARKPPKYVRHA